MLKSCTTETPQAPLRPIMRYHGAKWRLAPWVTSFFPTHKVYVEPFGGGGSVLLRKERSISEIYNELDNEVTNLFQVLRSPELSEQLRQALGFTPFSRVEYDKSYELAEDPVEQARRTLVKTWMGTRSKGLMNRSGFDTRINTDGYTSRINTFVKLPELVDSYRERLSKVIIENTDALTLIPRIDRSDALFYVDPPYVPESRSGKYYRHELTNEGHRDLAKVLHDCKGMVILSGYPSELYDQELYGDWHREECSANTDGAHARTEVLWINPAAWNRLQAEQAQLCLFNESPINREVA